LSLAPANHRTEIEDVPDEDAPGYPEMTEWNGEATFWGPHDELEFFDDEDAPEWDKRPIDDILDPEGEDPEEDDATLDMKVKRRFIFPPSQADAEQAFKPFCYSQDERKAVDSI
jgi:hypothetical protein